MQTFRNTPLIAPEQGGIDTEARPIPTSPQHRQEGEKMAEYL